ncbi:MAG: signal peptidase I [candidate division Zixibacteria bacterium]
MLATVWDYTKSLGIALIMALMIKTSVVEAYKIPSSSMEETLLVGDFLLANKFVFGMRLPIPFVDIKLPALSDPVPGDIVIFKYPKDPSQNYIKRCIAVEGQSVRIENKQVYVDGKPVPLPEHGQYLDNRILPYMKQRSEWGQQNRDNMPEITVPSGMLFMMGDNRDNSSDSRFWGFLDRKLVVGKAMVIHWSWATDPRAPNIRASDPFSVAKSVAYNIYHFPDRVRWSRLGDIIK